MKVEWKVIVAREEKHFYTSFSVDSVKGGVWHHAHLFLTLPVNSVGADEVRLQPVVQPVVDFDLDEVQLQPTSDNKWEEEANARIDVVRRRDVFFSYYFARGSDSGSNPGDSGLPLWRCHLELEHRLLLGRWQGLPLLLLRQRQLQLAGGLLEDEVEVYGET